MRKEIKMDSREEDIQMRQMMMKEATGMDLIMVAQGRNRISKSGNRPAKAPRPRPNPSPSRKPATIFRKVNHTVPQKSASCQIPPRRSTTDRGEGTSSFWPTPIASPCHTARASNTAPAR